jgi:pimeloyl-ACP methyl ester carboxylesterase
MQKGSYVLKPKIIGPILSALIFIGCAHQTVAPKAETVSSGYAPVNGIDLYYEIHGERREGQAPLVLIHGGGSTIESNYSKFLPMLARSRQVIAIEEAGHGHTKAASRAFNFINSADDVAALLDYLKIQNADLFGFSNGGTIVIQVAIRHPEKVHRIVVASGTYRRDGLMKGFFEGMNHATIEMMPQALKDADRKINPDPQHQRELFTQDSQRMVHFEDIADEKIHAIRAPVLVLNGDRDVVTLEHAARISQTIPGARLAILPSIHGAYVGAVEAGPFDQKLVEATELLTTEFLDSSEK